MTQPTPPQTPPATRPAGVRPLVATGRSATPAAPGRPAAAPAQARPAAPAARPAAAPRPAEAPRPFGTPAPAAAKPAAAAPAAAKPAAAPAVVPAPADANVALVTGPAAVEVPFGSPAQQAAEKAAAAKTATAAQATFLPGPRVAVGARRTVPPFDELTMLLFGKPGSGKSAFAAGNQGAYFLSLEPGQHFLDAAIVEIRSWGQFQAHVVAMANQKQAGQSAYHTVAIDIIDILSSYCRDFVCKQKGLAYPPETDFGKTWKEVREEWQKWVRALMRTVNVVFITHCNESPRQVSLETGIKAEVHVSHPTFAGGSGGKMGEYLDGVVNAMGHLRIKANGRHAISFVKDALTDAKDRTDILSKLGEIELPVDAAAGWELVSKAYAAKAVGLGCDIQSLWVPGVERF